MHRAVTNDAECKCVTTTLQSTKLLAFTRTRLFFNEGGIPEW